MMNLRMWHSYLSVFVAPSILFFALTGSVQLFSLHEARGGYHPPLLTEKLGRLHKDQVFAQDEPNEPPMREESSTSTPAAHDDASQGSPADEPRIQTLMLKWFFLAVAVVLMLSTCLGLWIALTHITRRRVSGIVLLIGVLVPIGLLIL